MVKSLDEVIERLQYKADNIKAKLEPSYFTECIDYLKSIIPCYLGSPCEYQTEDVNHNHGWIPCGERLPEVNGEYSECFLVTNEDDWQGMAYYHVKMGWVFGECHNSDRKIDWTEIVAWQPLPEPYKGEQ